VFVAVLALVARALRDRAPEATLRSAAAHLVGGAGIFLVLVRVVERLG